MEKIIEKYDFSNPSNLGYDPEIPRDELHEAVSNLLDLLEAYDKYIKEFQEQHGNCMDGCYPVCVEEFYFNDYQEENKE